MSNSTPTFTQHPATLEAQHPPSQPTSTQSTPRTRVPLVDRLALRLGLALITWSRRSRTPESWERRSTRIEQELARETRERAAQHLALRTAPPR